MYFLLPCALFWSTQSFTVRTFLCALSWFSVFWTGRPFCRFSLTLVTLWTFWTAMFSYRLSVHRVSQDTTVLVLGRTWPSWALSTVVCCCYISLGQEDFADVVKDKALGEESDQIICVGRVQLQEHWESQMFLSNLEEVEMRKSNENLSWERLLGY